jgi:hypothetical protein
MYCPQCRTEYREHYTECSDCHVALLPGAPPTEPPEPPDPFDPSLELVVVFETNDRVQLSMARGMLEDAGIPFYLNGQIATLVQDIDPFLFKWIKIQIARDREEEARKLLEPLLQPETAFADADEGPSSGSESE